MKISFDYITFATQKYKTSKNQLTKEKHANIKQQRQQLFVHQNLIRGRGGGWGGGERMGYFVFFSLYFFFQIQISMLQTGRAGKNGVVCLVSMLSSIHLKFIESRHLEVTKNPYYPLCPEWSQKGYQLMD